MLIPIEFISKKRGLLDPADYEDSIEHTEFAERLRKSFYYGKTPNTDRPSFPVSELAVDFFKDAAPRELGRVDLTFASSISRQACISPCSMMLGMIYVDRLKHRNPEYLQLVSSSDLFLISMMMASKYLYDEGVDEEVFNDEWAESADMDVEDVNTLERNFLKAIEWQLYVRKEEFFDLLERIERSVARDKGRERGFLTYNDLVALSGDNRLNQALRAILGEMRKVFMVCSVAYVAGVLTMVGSTMTLVYLQQSLPVQPLIPTAPITTTTTTTSDMTLPTPRSPSVERNLGVADNQGLWSIEGNGSADNGKGQWQKTERESVRTLQDQNLKSTIGMSGLLTLAFIKDTVVQFVMAMKSEDRNGVASVRSETVNADEVVTGNFEDDVVCTCGCCEGPMDQMRHCVNVSVDHNEHGYRNFQMDNLNSNRLWARHRHPIGHIKNTRHDVEGCDALSGSRCCCRPLLPWQPNRSLGTVKQSNLEKPFHNVVLGFGTTAEALVSG